MRSCIGACARAALRGGFHALLIQGGGGWLGPPSSCAPPMVPAEGGGNFVRLKSSCHESKTLAVSLNQTLEEEEEEGGGGVKAPSSYGVRPF